MTFSFPKSIGVGASQPHHLWGLIAFGDEFRTRRRILVTCDPEPRLYENKTEILPWKVFLRDLWAGKIIR
jgi:hypothetical protein